MNSNPQLIYEVKYEDLLVQDSGMKWLFPEHGNIDIH